jgi:NADPH:quinone reductase-like Zn-dependent oxidoreductase
MKAIVSSKYGPPEVLRLQEVDMPVMSADGVLVRVLAASVNPLDWLSMRGEPLLMRPMTGFPRPKRTVPGVDVAGVVERVGANVTGMQPGDEVFGWCWGTFAEYVCGGEKDLVPKPEGLSFTEAAAVPLAGQTALQALRDHGKLQPGQRVLVNGAAGGVGTFAVQVAKALGAHVVGVCSTRNVEMVRSIGADEVVDYTAEDFTHKKEGYDLVLDTVGNRSLSRMRRALAPHGTLLVVGAGGGRLLGPVSQMLRATTALPLCRPEPGPVHGQAEQGRPPHPPADDRRGQGQACRRADVLTCRSGRGRLSVATANSPSMATKFPTDGHDVAGG